MDSKLQEMLIKVITISNQGYTEEAINLIKKLLLAFPNDREILYYQRAEILYKDGNLVEALFDYINSYECNNNKITRDAILNKYYFPYKEEYIQRYNENKILLDKYEFFYGQDKYDIDSIYPLYEANSNIIYYDSNNEKFILYKSYNYKFKLEENNHIIADNIIYPEICENIIKSDRQIQMLSYRKPIFFYYDVDKWIVMNLLFDISKILADKKAVIIIGEDKLYEIFDSGYYNVPDIILTNKSRERFTNIFNYVSKKRYENFCQYKEFIEEYYSSTDVIDEHIKNNNIRIMFLTSRYTTVLQYHSKDMEIAARKMGYETLLLIEPEDIFFANDYVIMKEIYAFRPDILFVIDHFRYEYKYLKQLENLRFITWIQDPMDHIIDVETSSKIGKNDYVLNHLVNLPEVKRVKYPKERLMNAPVVASQYKYKLYDLNELESKDIERYTSDVCIVCHASDVDNYIHEFTNLFDDSLTDLVKKLCYSYIEYIKSGNNFIYSQDGFIEFVLNYLNTNGIKINPSNEAAANFIGAPMYKWLNQRVYRQVMVDTLIDAGITNIKLWGKGWNDNPKYAPYAMGVADNGKELSLIYQCSKIVLGNNVMTTAAARAWETMLSGGFYMSNYIPPEYDVCDIRKIMKEGEEVVIFKDNKDLVDKVKFYLEHEEERHKMIEIGHKVALERMTFDILCKKMIDFVRGFNESDVK